MAAAAAAVVVAAPQRAFPASVRRGRRGTSVSVLGARLDPEYFELECPDGLGPDRLMRVELSDGRLAVHVEVRDAADPPDDPPFWLSLVPVPGAVDPDGGGEPEPAWAGSQVPIHVAPLDPPAAVLTARLTLATEPFVTNGDGDRVAVARLEIDVGPRRLSSPLALELPEPLPSRSGTRVPTEVRAAIENAEELELLAMGGADTERTFHGHAVAGAVPSADPVLRRRIAWVLQKAALLGPTWSVECFEPQLGIRIRDPRLGTFDLLVSASCSKLLVHQPGQEVVPVRLDEAVTWGLFAEIAAATGLALPRDG